MPGNINVIDLETKQRTIRKKTYRTKPVLILGIGNILMRDEGVGVRVIEALQKESLPNFVELVDGGTAGADLLDILSDRQRVIIIDAMQSEHPPGTVSRLSPADLNPCNTNPLSLHDLAIAETLDMTKLLDCTPKEVIIFGIQPNLIEPGLELSDAVSRSITRIIELVLQELHPSLPSQENPNQLTIWPKIDDDV